MHVPVPPSPTPLTHIFSMRSIPYSCAVLLNAEQPPAPTVPDLHQTRMLSSLVLLQVRPTSFLLGPGQACPVVMRAQLPSGPSFAPPFLHHLPVSLPHGSHKKHQREVLVRICAQWPHSVGASLGMPPSQQGADVLLHVVAE